MSPEDIRRGFQNHSTFCRESLTVETEGRNLVPMVLGPGQLRLEEAIQKQRKQGRPVRIIYLKSRRIQATTGTAARFFHDTAFYPGVHTVVMAHDATSTENIFSIYRRFHDTYKRFAGAIRLPATRVLSDRIFFQYGGDPESSWIQIHTAGTVTFGRSFRLDNAHFSEYPYYPDPAGTRAAVMSAVAKLPSTTAIIEGTAKNIGDDFHKLWQQAVDPNHESEWLALFMGWWEHPGNSMPLATPPDVFQKSLTDTEWELKQRYNLSLEQLAWRRFTIINDFSGDSIKFKREHPATAEEAFAASSRNRFSVPHVERMPVKTIALTGDLVVDEIGGERRLMFVPGERGALRVWRRPERGRFYAAGADPAGGADAAGGEGEPDPDWAVCHIFDRDTGEQCATFRARMWPGAFGRYLYLLLRWYNNAQICLEKTGAGIGTLESLLNEGYPPGLIYHRPATLDQDPQVRSDRIGWDTNPVSREQALSLLDEAIRGGAIVVYDEVTQHELLTFVVNPRGKAEAEKGVHDDTVLALAFVCIVMAKMPRPVVPEKRAAPQVMKYGRPVESGYRDYARR